MGNFLWNTYRIADENEQKISHVLHISFNSLSHIDTIMPKQKFTIISPENGLMTALKSTRWLCYTGIIFFLHKETWLPNYRFGKFIPTLKWLYVNTPLTKEITKNSHLHWRILWHSWFPQIKCDNLMSTHLPQVKHTVRKAYILIYLRRFMVNFQWNFIRNFIMKFHNKLSRKWHGTHGLSQT